MSSIALGMQVNELERRIAALENKAGGSAMMGDMMKDILILHGMARKQEERLAELESMVAMMRHAIDVAVLPQGRTATQSSAVIAEVFGEEDPFPLNDNPIAPVKPAKVKATRA